MHQTVGMNTPKVKGVGAHLSQNEEDLKSNVAEQEDEEGDGGPNQVDGSTRGKTHRVAATGHLLWFLFDICSTTFTSQMPIAESQPNLPKPNWAMENSKTAGLMMMKARSQMKRQLIKVAWELRVKG